jgi:glycerophosphoryl diester phosphodiesterase
MTVLGRLPAAPFTRRDDGGRPVVAAGVFVAALLAVALAWFAGPAPAAATVAAVISAHRGGAGQWPQNSLLAFRNSLAADYDEIEADTWVLADGWHVIYHDVTISKERCGGPYAGRDIWKLTHTQVRTIRCQGQPIPTEAQLLALVEHSSNQRTVLRLETKSYPGQSASSAYDWARRVGRQVVEAGLAARSIMQDFNWNGIAGYHAAAADLRVSALTDTITDALIVRAHDLGAYDISYRAAHATSAVNSYAAGRDLVPTVWGVDPVPAVPGPPSPTIAAASRAEFKSAVCSGVRVVITNYPGLLTAYRPDVSCSS